MKKFKLKSTLICLLCALPLVLAGCDESKPSEPSVRYEEEWYNSKINESITARTEFPEYDANVKKINIELINPTNDEAWTDDANGLLLLKQESDRWRYAEFIDDTCLATATLIPPNGTLSKTLDVEKHYRLPLSPGNYRIRINVGGYVYAEFTVK